MGKKIQLKKYSTIYCSTCNVKVLQVFLAEKEECTPLLYLCILRLLYWGKKSESTQEL